MHLNLSNAQNPSRSYNEVDFIHKLELAKRTFITLRYIVVWRHAMMRSEALEKLVRKKYSTIRYTLRSVSYLISRWLLHFFEKPL